MLLGSWGLSVLPGLGFKRQGVFQGHRWSGGEAQAPRSLQGELPGNGSPAGPLYLVTLYGPATTIQDLLFLILSKDSLGHAPS